MQFAALVLMMPLDKAMFGGTTAAGGLARLADAGVRVFLSACGSE
jgi:hypothetical protein